MPDGLEGPAPLVVVLHGCTQDAAVYDHGSGWSALADKHGFILLFPEQKRDNNPLLCFNWFLEGDTQRGMGEAASIAGMIAAVKQAHAIDPGRVFVTDVRGRGVPPSGSPTYPDRSPAAPFAGVAYAGLGRGRAFDCMSAFAGERRELGEKSAAPRRTRGPGAAPDWHGSCRSHRPRHQCLRSRFKYRSFHGLVPKPDARTGGGYPRGVAGSDGPADRA